MGRKPVIDREVVRAALEQVGSANGAAKLLNLPTNTVLAISRELKGLCPGCGREPTEDGKRCAKCAAYMAQRTNSAYHARRRMGLCVQCGAAADPPDSHMCAKHHSKRASDARTLRAKYRAERGDEYKAMVSKWQRHTRYGPAGAAVWLRADGRCEICGFVTQKKHRLHLHHIDEDRENNTEENLVCICNTCHNLIHYIKWHPNLAAFLPWFRKTYPDTAPDLALH